MLYSIVIHLYYLILLVAFPFSKKARLWIRGRMGWRRKLRQWQHSGSPTFWFHAASLGEFEQGRPLIEEIIKQQPACNILLTFYSPSGFEIRRNYPEAGHVCYLPLDTRYNAREFVRIAKPDAAFFIKYEFWNFYLKRLHAANIPTYLISGIFRPSQAFFHWYGLWFRDKLSYFTHFFLQDRESLNLLNSLGLHNTTVTGDTRFDRVLEIAAQAKHLELVEAFTANGFCLVAGSTWPADEELLTRYINESDPQIKVIIAPHETDIAHIKRLTAVLNRSYILYSASGIHNVGDKQVLIIDNIGMLSSIYRYGQLAYIGGGFGKGIHNILEAAVFGIPVVFGPNFSKFREANQMIDAGGAFSVNSLAAFEEIVNNLISNTEFRHYSSLQAKNYIIKNAGATRQIARQVIKAR